MPRLKSQNPKSYDNTEQELILVSPSVLDNKLRDFEVHNRYWSSLPGDITLAITLIIAIFTASFIDFPFIKGSTIRGTFIAGLVLTSVKIVFSLIQLAKYSGHARSDLIRSFLKESKNKKEEK